MSENHQKIIFDILGSKPIAFNPVLAEITGSVNAGLFLSQLLYWAGKGKDENGWIYKTIKEVEKETFLSRKEQENAIKKLKNLCIIQVELRGVPAKRHFRVNFDVLFSALKQTSLSKRGKLDCPKGANKIVQKGQTNTYNTTYNTTDIPYGSDSENHSEKEPLPLKEGEEKEEKVPLKEEKSQVPAVFEYFTKKCLEDEEMTPVIDYGKEGRLIKRALPILEKNHTTYEQLIDFYFESPEYEKFGASLSYIFSSVFLNKFLTKKGFTDEAWERRQRQLEEIRRFNEKRSKK